MKGLPFKASVDDVLKFYQGFTLCNTAVYLKRHADGRLNGEVCCAPQPAALSVNLPCLHHARGLLDTMRRLAQPFGSALMLVCAS
jgi:hypothetical protein